MTTLNLFATRSFLIWNMTIQSGKTFEISDWIGNEMIKRGICITVEEREKRIAAKAERKAKQKAEDSIKTDIPGKRGRKPKGDVLPE